MLGPVFDNAIRKYGLENFEYGFLTHCKIEELDNFEMFYIRRLNTKVPNGYNMTDGGDGVRGVKWSDEKREEYRIRNLGEGNPNFGNRWNEEQKRRASEYMKERIKREGLICVRTPEIAKKAYETFLLGKYGKTMDEIDSIIKKHIDEGGLKSYSDIRKKYGFSVKTIERSFERLGIGNPRSEKLKEAYKHNPYLVQCDRLDHNKILNIFPSLKVATEKTGIKSIHHCAHGIQENAGGYFWRFNVDGESPSEVYNEEFLRPLEDRRKLTRDQIERMKKNGVWTHKKLMKKVYCFNLKGELVDICESTKEAGKKYSINPTEISAICRNGKQKTAKGMTFSYTDKPVIDKFYQTKILQYTVDGKLVKEYDSVREAARETGAAEGSISSCFSGRYKTSVGYVWKKKEILFSSTT